MNEDSQSFAFIGVEDKVATYKVRSESNELNVYTIVEDMVAGLDQQRWSCSCEGFKFKKSKALLCKHIERVIKGIDLINPSRNEGRHQLSSLVSCGNLELTGVRSEISKKLYLKMLDAASVTVTITGELDDAIKLNMARDGNEVNQDVALNFLKDTRITIDTSIDKPF